MTTAAALPATRRPSLARRLFRTVAAILGISVLVTFVAVELIANKFEVTLLHRELALEVQAMKGHPGAGPELAHGPRHRPVCARR